MEQGTNTNASEVPEDHDIVGAMVASAIDEPTATRFISRTPMVFLAPFRSCLLNLTQYFSRICALRTLFPWHSVLETMVRLHGSKE